MNVLRNCLIVVVGMFSSFGFADEPRTPLLHVAKGQLPNDTAHENRTKFSIETSGPELGGKLLKVVYAPGDTFGMSRGQVVRDWRSFATIELTVFNPSPRKVNLTFVVKHARSRNYGARIDLPIVLSPGENAIQFPIADITNNDGSRPDWTSVRHWYIASSAGESPTLYFGDIWLVAAQSTHLKGTDPARLSRIRATTMPKVTKPIEFATPEADAVLSALEVFPPDNAFNQSIEDWPTHPNSRNIVASVGLDKPLRYNPDMSFIIVPPNQPRVDVRVVDYPGESDKGPFPIPANIPIEGWPVHYQRHVAKMPTLAQVQQRPAKYGGDRHAIVVDPVNRMLFEFFTFGKTANGWAAGQASVFDLKTNKLRPDGWTSADAAGLPIFPAVVRYDEIQRGIVEHAMRVTIRRSRRAYVHPATHYASRLTDVNLPRMGERFRLRSDFDISSFSKPVQAILKGLKKYGMLVADNGIDWAISVAPDPRIPVLHEELRKIRGRDFEVVVSPRTR